jgi:hypothetical protein
MNCRYCGAHHGALCPMVKAYEYYPTGELKRVEFWTRYELDNRAKAANPVVMDPRPLGTSTGSIGGTAVGALFNPQGHPPITSMLVCDRCGKEGHHSLTCSETMDEMRRRP